MIPDSVYGGRSPTSNGAAHPGLELGDPRRGGIRAG